MREIRSDRFAITTSTINRSRFRFKKYMTQRSFFVSAHDSHKSGVTFIELVRKMEDDRVISRDDRLALDYALNDPKREDSVIALLLKIELSKNTQFFEKRLKALIHQNPSGLPILGGGVHSLGTHPLHCSNLEQQLEPLLVNILSSCSLLDRCKNVPRLLTEKIIPPYSNFLSPERLEHHERGQGQNLQTPFSPASIPSLADSPLISRRRSITNSTRRGSDNSYDKSVQYSFDEDLYHDNDYQYNDTKLEIGIKSSTTLRSLEGRMPLYSKQDYFGVCSKILTRYYEFNSSGIISKLPQFAVLVCSASCNPLTKMYLRSFYLARKHLEKAGYIVLGTLLSPLHGINVREKYRNYPSEIIPSPHRLIVSQLMVQNDKFISIDPWEMSRKRAMDYLSVLQHCKEILHEILPNIKTKIIYVCTDNVIPKISLNAMKKENFACICVCR